MTFLVGAGLRDQITTVTVTVPTATTVTIIQPTQTVTKTMTVTTTTQTQYSPYKIEATTETVNGSLIGIIIVSAPPGDFSLIVADPNEEILTFIHFPKGIF